MNSDEKRMHDIIMNHVELGVGVYDDLIDHIKENFAPQDIFDKDALIGWAEDQDPNDIYSVSFLEQWAMDNGYTK
jgi:hypothetical protein